MAEENKKDDYSEENKKRMLIALAVYLGFTDINKAEEWNNLTKEEKKIVRQEFEGRNLKQFTDNPNRLPERDIQIQVAEKGLSDKIDVYKIVGNPSPTQCEDCRKWMNRKVTMESNTIGLPTVQDFINSHGFHPNCRCSLQPVSVDEIPLKEPNPRIDQRKQSRPDIYNSTPTEFLVFN